MNQPSEDFSIHRAGERSLVELAEQHAAGFAGYATPIHMDAAALADRIRSEHIDLWSSFMLRQGDENMVLTLIARRGNRSRVASMGVPTHARRSGWGRRAMRVAIDEAHRRGDSLQLEVLTENHGAVALYESEGFSVARTLVGFEGTLQPGPASPARRLRASTVGEVAARVALLAPDLPWQLEAASLHGLGEGWRAWTNGPSSAIARRRDDQLTLISLVTEPDERRRGHARALLDQIAAHEGTRRIRVISIVPQGLAEGFFERCGVGVAALRQYEMRRLDRS